MKGLIFREFRLAKKSMLMTLGIGIVFYVLGILILLSGKYGNLAKYSDPNEIKEMMDCIQSYIPLMAVIMFFVGAEDAINATAYSDQQCGWHKYMRASEARIHTYVGAKYLSMLISLLLSVLLLFLILPFFLLVGGKVDRSAFAIMVSFLAFMLLYFDYVMPVAFYIKKREKGILWSVIPMILLFAAASAVAVVFTVKPELGEYFERALSSDSLNKWGYIAFAAALLLMYVSYRLSVRIVTRES